MHASGPAVALAAPIRPIVGPGTARPAPSPLEQLSVCGVEATAMRETRLLQVALDMPGEPERGDDPLARNEEAFLAVLEEAARFDPDFVHAPELTLAYNLDRDARDVADLAHRLPGSFTDRVGERARALDSYVWVPTYERADGSVYNSVALIDPGGTYRGAYRKVAPTVTELEQRGVTPGRELPVWDTEFGRVGATICYDVRFDEIGLGYRSRGVDLLFHPTHGLGHGKLRHWATYHGYHVAYCFPSDARVYTPHGNTVGRTTSHPTTPSVSVDDAPARFAPVTVNTDMQAYAMGSLDYGDSELDAVQRTYPDAIEIHSRFEDGIVVIESVAEDVTVAEVEAEFDLPTTRAAERRARDLATDAVPDSPLLSFRETPDGFSARRAEMESEDETN